MVSFQLVFIMLFAGVNVIKANKLDGEVIFEGSYRDFIIGRKGAGNHGSGVIFIFRRKGIIEDPHLGDLHFRRVGVGRHILRIEIAYSADASEIKNAVSSPGGRSYLE
ncbi:hypothetical protein FQZ97_1068460 [compost metagenome]